MRYVIVISTVIACLFAWLTFMVFDNTPPYVYDVANSYIKPPSSDLGRQVTVYWKIERVNRVCPGILHRQLIDLETGVIVADYDPIPTAPEGGIRDGYFPKTFLLPQEMNVSRPRMIGYRTTGCYWCNPYQFWIRPLCVTTAILPFEVR